MDDRENYFNYVTNVLGIKTILVNQDTTFAPKDIPLLLVVEGLFDYTAAETELLEKMIAALKMNPQTYNLVNLDPATERIRRGFTVEFRDNVGAGSLQNVQQVFSPRTLLKQPNLKKQAWEDLQKVIRHFSA